MANITATALLTVQVSEDPRMPQHADQPGQKTDCGMSYITGNSKTSSNEKQKKVDGNKRLFVGGYGKNIPNVRVIVPLQLISQ